MGDQADTITTPTFLDAALAAASSELHLAATAFNLRKIHRAAYC
jgi:hypothetical protein